IKKIEISKYGTWYGASFRKMV
ncbi:hypothetical protein DBR06_SOUSAS12310026, partial [Sousa chinensis]